MKAIQESKRSYQSNRNEAPNLKSVCLALNLNDANIRNGYRMKFNKRPPKPELKAAIAAEYLRQAQQFAEQLKQ